MVFFITVMRAIAACLITNAHYTGIYPTDLIANGGLIGDTIFFAVSGYCLCNIQHTFAKWYFKRLYRVLIPVWVISLVFLALGFFSLEQHSITYYFVYPTDYHFVASIILLYLPFYFIIRCQWTRNNLPKVMLILAVVMMVVYVCFYDKSYYHIDAVREPFIRFLFMECMLLGAYFKQKDCKFRNKFSCKWVIFFVVAFVGYFATKMLFVKYDRFAFGQIINQLIIFALLYCFFRLFAGMDEKLEKLPQWIKKVISFIAKLTLEIYIVQYVAIDMLRPVFGFPINWFVITGAIVVSAFVVHYLCTGVYYVVDYVVKRMACKNKRNVL